MKRNGLGDFNVTNKTKQNELPCFIDRLVVVEARSQSY